ncbi:hypothetical protein SLE2022_052510 [Rubroshorea leprosula]
MCVHQMLEKVAVLVSSFFGSYRTQDGHLNRQVLVHGLELTTEERMYRCQECLKVLGWHGWDGEGRGNDRLEQLTEQWNVARQKRQVEEKKMLRV